MLVTVVTSAWLTHLLPMLPLARQLRAAGHDVVVAAPPDLRAQVLAQGLPCRPVGEAVDYLPTFRAVLAGRDPRPTAKAAPGPRPRALELFVVAAESMAGDLARLVTARRHGLVLYEPAALAAPLVAALAGVPAVRVRYGPDLFAVHEASVEDLLRPTVRRLTGGSGGVGHLDRPAEVTLDPCPPALRAASTGPQPRPIGYRPCWPGSTEVGLRIPARRRGRPRVCVTLGSTLHRLDPGRLPVDGIARGLQDVDADVVVVGRPEQAAALQPLQRRATVLLDAALHAVVPFCDLVISNGSAGTVLTAAGAGVPHLMLPQLPDHAFHAARLAGTGAGRVLPAQDLAATLPAAVGEVLGDLRYAGAALTLADWMAYAPSPRQVAAELPRHAVPRRAVAA